MKQILVYGDSLTLGHHSRHTPAASVFRSDGPASLRPSWFAAGSPSVSIEDCLNGRRTVWDDPFKAGRNGLAGIEQRIEVNSPLALVILMLGTNDFQSVHQYKAWHSAQGIASLVRAIRRAPIEPDMPVPPILIIAPPPTGIRRDDGGEVRRRTREVRGISPAYAAIAAELSCAFFDAGDVISVSKVDGVHLDADQHEKLGRHLVDPVRKLL